MNFLRTPAGIRALRMILWILAMGVTDGVVGWFWPYKVMWVPPLFLAIMVPAVLLPLPANAEKSPKPEMH